jgi:hypothetical protein
VADLPDGNGLEKLDLTQIHPYFSISVLECTSEDLQRAFGALIRFLRSEAGKRGHAIAANVLAEVTLDTSKESADQDESNSIGAFSVLGFDRVYGIARQRTQPAPWAARDSVFIDTVNELTLALSRNRLVAIRSDIVSSSILLKWAGRSTTPFRALPPEVLAGTFDGDGVMLWMQGVHRQRARRRTSSRSAASVCKRR